jgi:hypothetical protein
MALKRLIVGIYPGLNENQLDYIVNKLEYFFNMGIRGDNKYVM